MYKKSEGYSVTVFHCPYNCVYRMSSRVPSLDLPKCVLGLNPGGYLIDDEFFSVKVVRLTCPKCKIRL